MKFSEFSVFHFLYDIEEKKIDLHDNGAKHESIYKKKANRWKKRILSIPLHSGILYQQIVGIFYLCGSAHITSQLITNEKNKSAVLLTKNSDCFNF